MTDDEYCQAKADIIKLHGEPIRDFDSKNESARLIDQLNYKRRAAAMKAGRERKLSDIVKDVPKEQLKAYSGKPLRPIYLEDKDLKQFSDLERQILQAHYEDSTLNNEQLATRFGVSRQQVTALFNSTEAKLLKIKLFERECPDKVRLALLHLVEDNDQKTTLRLAEHYNIVKAEKQDINIVSKPIEDPAAQKMLRELGDRMSNVKRSSGADEKEI